MNYNVYSIKDDLTGFMSLILEQNDVTAMRSFSMACDASKRDSSLMAFRPRDFVLYRLGSFDTFSGALNVESSPVAVCSGNSFFEEVDK